jgi:cytochrome P450
MKGKRPPEPPGWPGLGHLVPALRDPLGFLMQSYRRYGDVLGFRIGPIRGAALLGAEANRFILVDGVDKFTVTTLIERLRARWLVGDSLLFIDDPAHQQQRRLLLPAFHRGRIIYYQQMMTEATAQMLDRWRPGDTLDIAQAMHNLALVIMGRTLFSRELSGGARALSAAVAVEMETLNNPLRVLLDRWPVDIPGISQGATLQQALRRVRAILDAIITEHEQGGTDTGDMVSLLIAARDEAGNRLTRRQIQDQLSTLFVAGHETSANGLAWAFYLLAQHPAVMRTLLDELDAQLHGAPPSATDLDRLPYLEQVAKEALRLYPPLAVFNRTARETFTWHGYTVEAGTLVQYVPFVSHHMPDQFPEPETFRPERFDPTTGTPPSSYAYVPFGGGGRSCIGAPFAMMEIKTVLAMVLHRYRLDLVPDQQVVATLRATLQPKYGIQMRAQPQDGHPERSPAAVRGNVVGATPGPP